MKNYFKNPILKYDFALLIFLFVCAKLIRHYYPVPQFSWDSFYYIQTGNDHTLGIRPTGYSSFLNLLYHISHSLKFVVMVQFGLFYCATVFLMRTIKSLFSINNPLYLLLGCLLLAEPVALYHCNSVLSDVLFGTLTIFSLGSLLLYVNGRQYAFFILHVIFIFLSIEVRHIALFYPFFTLAALLLSGRSKWIIGFNTLLILLIYFSLYTWHVNQHRKTYGVAVYSPFSGWTHTNNALYGAASIPSDAIKDPEIRVLHEFFKKTIATNSFVVTQVGSAYLWDDESPMNVIRLKFVAATHCDFISSWFLCAPIFAEYGTYMQKHFPKVYLTTYIIPNLNTLVEPAYGEMSDYFITPFDAVPRYTVTRAQLTPRRQIYKEVLNKYIPIIYKTELILFALSSLLFLMFIRKFDLNAKRALFIIITFVGLFYALTLYSSWFMYRYLIPITPLLIATTVLVAYILIKRLVSNKEKIVA